MPNILVKIPADTFDGAARAALARRMTEAAALAEQIPEDPRKRLTTWVVVEEVAAGAWWCGGADLSAQIVPCLAFVCVPAGVLDAAARALFVQQMHDAFAQTLPAADGRRTVTSVVLHDVADGTWGVNGALWMLPDFARASGYAHLQHLATHA
ncbi:tautomerase family protein [Ralstonia insidiosa]|jgi:phenylpyruvate tautomerase PptA (4-oxalocrotonate tautomerase family)|uniref:tautomerase family protein n=1 Tax=Ralstonia TaxID=48736 RepID=UPI000664C1DE|nr:tautomerase family protein [Ralstonia insidiosa]KMW45493.1 tautomerase [Ralstonia sp. MD27]MBX3772308.1 tautomerase family protein [Ralstonia pickettii]NOZ17383.1 tautomerase [Betaproteobacteria bacterium]MBA9856965.1 tautomerase [Ralstonia insidiosa]MBA9873607.1 tautomerase [Ralstonia insidiosa]